MSRSKPLRDVGERIRSVLDKSLTDQVVQKAMEDVSCAVDDSVVTDVTQRLCEEFGVDLGTGKWPVELWRSILNASRILNSTPSQRRLPVGDCYRD